jgi:hypothetical protein
MENSMTEKTPPENPPVSSTPPVPAAAQVPLPAQPAEPKRPVKKKRHLWLKIIGGLVGLLVLLVLLLPTIASTGMVRSIVVEKVNDQLNGKLDIADWSFGWLSGARIDGVKVVDADGKQILQLKSLDAPISLMGAIFGHINLHKVVLDGLNFHAVREADGTLNFAQLAKPSSEEPSSAPPKEVSPPEPAEKSESPNASASAPPRQTKLPNVSGEIVVTNCTGTIDDVQAKTTAHLTSLEADVKIPDINQPIEDTFEAAIDNGKGATGKISADGKVLVVKDNILLTDPAQLIREADIDQKASLTGFDLGTIAPFLGSDSGIDKVAGVSDGEVDIRFKPMTDADISAMLKIVKLAVSGKALKGDTFAAQSLQVNASHIALVLPADAKGVDAARIRTGPTDGSSPISVTLLQEGGSKSTVTLFADVPQSAMDRIAKNLAPGDTGTIRAAADIDLAHLVTSMPHLLALQPGLTLKSGRLTDATSADLTPDKLVFKQSLAVTDVAGHDATSQRDIVLQPIDLSGNVSDLGGGGMLPDVRNLKFDFSSGFANATAQADSIDNLTAQVHASLQQAQNELGQVIDFGKTQLFGNLDVVVSSKGNLLGGGSSTGPAHTAAIDVHGTLKDLRITEGAQTTASEPLTQFALTGQLHGSDTQAIEKLSGLDLTAMAGDAQHPLLDSEITAELAMQKAPGAAPADATTAMVLQQAVIKKMNLDLAMLQQQFGGMIPALSKVHIGAGTLIVGGSAKNNGQSTHSTIQTYLNNVDLQQLAAAGGQPVPLLSGYTLHILTDGTLTADSSGSKVSVKLEADDNQKLLSVQKTDAQLQLTTGSGDDARAVGLLDMVKSAEASISVPSLAKVDAVLNALSPAQETTSASDAAAPAKNAKPKPAVTAGSALITLSVTHSDGQLKIVPKISITPDLAVAAGSVSQVVGPIDCTTDIAITPAEASAAGPTLIDQIKALDISQLSVNAVGTSISLKQPLHIADLGGLTRLLPSTAPSAASSGPPPAISAQLIAKGDVAPLAHLMETLDAAAQGTEYPYTGNFDLDETVGTTHVPDDARARIKDLTASGGLHVTALDGQGIDIKNLVIPIFLKMGKLYIANSDKAGDYAAAASMNGGTVNLSGVVVDLADPHRTLSMNPNSDVMKGVALNTALAHLLGKSFGNLLFADAGGSTGILNVTVEKCDQVPTDETLKENVPSNQGSLAMDVQIQDLTLTGGTLGSALEKIGPALQVILPGKSIPSQSIKGSVKDYKITLAHGITTHNMTITLGEHERSIHLTSTVDLLKLQLKDTFLTLPLSLFGGNDNDLPNGINLALTGTATSPKFDAGKAVQKSLLGNGKPLDAIKNLFGGKKAGQSDSSGGNSGANNAVNELQGLFGKKKSQPAATQPGD